MKILSAKKINLLCGVMMASLVPVSAIAANHPAINAAVLPTSRTTVIGTPITVFGTIANSGPGGATACSVGLQPDTLSGGPNPSGLSISYRAFQADNATPAAPQDTPIDIAAGANQAFVLSISGTGSFNQEIFFDFSCDSGAVRAPSFVGVNTLSLLNATSALPDIITIGTSPSLDAVIRIPSLGAGEIMAVAALNIGAAAPVPVKGESGAMAGANEVPVIVAPDFGDYDLALDAFICETDPTTAVCLAPYARSVTTNVGNQPSTFNVFVNSTLGAGVPLYADIARQFIRFYEDKSPTPTATKGVSSPSALPPAGSGLLYGATSHAVTSPGPAILETTNYPDGIWDAAFDVSSGGGGTRSQGVIAVTVEGEWLAFVPDTQVGQVFQFGSMATDTSATPNPSLTLDFQNIEDDQNSPTEQQVSNNYQGTGSWQPFSFISGSVSFNPPPAAPAKKGVSKPAIYLQNSANFRAVYNPVYDRAVTFASLAGTYDLLDIDQGTGAVSDSGNVVIDATGLLSGTVSPEPGENCNLTGDLTEYANGKNLFAVTITLSGCGFADTFLGHGFQFDSDDFIDGSLTPDVFGIVFRGDTSGMAAQINLVPQGTVVLP